MSEDAEQRIRELCDERDPIGPLTLERIVRTAWREATEAAAKKCEAVEAEIQRLRLLEAGKGTWPNRDYVTDEMWAVWRGQVSGAIRCAAAIRKQP